MATWRPGYVHQFHSRYVHQLVTRQASLRRIVLLYLIYQNTTLCDPLSVNTLHSLNKLTLQSTAARK